MKLKAFYRRHSKKILAVLLLATIAEIALSFAFDKTPEKLVESLPWLLGLAGLTEALFILGLVIMAYSVGHDLGWNPIKWHGHLKSIVHKVSLDKLFWVGFWVNTTGALGTGIVWLIAILYGLPISSWGSLWLPLADIALTVSLRSAVFELKREKAL
ncbi:hypothetical protein KC878_03975 [Candidatus Saccharibacteria bacterium]|nr:hypothetical protein [Candidatus Saccharibacteria bacterium]MCB9820920.1 hypothetical protein [Candidatus Nomurabacteria bacterium]